MIKIEHSIDNPLPQAPGYGELEVGHLLGAFMLLALGLATAATVFLTELVLQGLIRGRPGRSAARRGLNTEPAVI